MHKHKLILCVLYFYSSELLQLYAFLLITIENRHCTYIAIAWKRKRQQAYLLQEESLSLGEIRKGCVGKSRFPISHFDLYTLFSTCSRILRGLYELRSIFKYWGVGAGATYRRDLFQQVTAYNKRAFVRRYHLRLWIVVVYKFGNTLTDYKYHLSWSKCIINSFINSGNY